MTQTRVYVKGTLVHVSVSDQL